MLTQQVSRYLLKSARSVLKGKPANNNTTRILAEFKRREEMGAAFDVLGDDKELVVIFSGTSKIRQALQDIDIRRGSHSSRDGKQSARDKCKEHDPSAKSKEPAGDVDLGAEPQESDGISQILAIPEDDAAQASKSLPIDSSDLNDTESLTGKDDAMMMTMTRYWY